MSITLRIKIEDKKEALNNIDSVINCLLDERFKTGSTNNIYISKNIDLLELTRRITNVSEQYTIGIQDGITGGCYGARDGKTYKGLTLYCDAELFPERWIDEDNDEIVNFKILFNKYADELTLNPDEFRESMEELGIESSSDNTYNYLGHSDNEPVPFQHVNFECFKKDPDELGYSIIIAKFHCGGDVRGNYTEEKVYKFKDPEDAYFLFSTGLELKEVEE